MERSSCYSNVQPLWSSHTGSHGQAGRSAAIGRPAALALVKLAPLKTGLLQVAKRGTFPERVGVLGNKKPVRAWSGRTGLRLGFCGARYATRPGWKLADQG